jgi:hypothetical protein
VLPQHAQVAGGGVGHAGFVTARRHLERLFRVRVGASVRERTAGPGGERRRHRGRLGTGQQVELVRR